MSQIPHDKLSKDIYKASRLIRCTNQRAFGLSETIHMWRGLVHSGKPTWPICRVSPGKTVELGTFSRWLMNFSSSPGQCRTTPKTRRQSQRLSGRCSHQRTYATLSAYRLTKARNSSTRTSRRRWNATESSTWPVRAIKGLPWWSDSIELSKLRYGHICRTPAPWVGWMSSRTWSTPTITNETALSAWRRLMPRRKTRTLWVRLIEEGDT